MFTSAAAVEEEMDISAIHFVWRMEPPREDAIQKFQKYFSERIEKDSEFRRRVLELKGKKLGCFCKPKACHGDVIADWLNKMEEKEMDQ